MNGTRTPPEPASVTPQLFTDRVRALLRPRGGPRPWPKRQIDRWILLHCISRRIEPGEELAERAVNARIQDWLIGPGRSLEVDFVTLRRALIDEGFWDRDSGGTRYRSARHHQRRVRFEPGLPGESDVLAEADRRATGREGGAPSAP